MAKYKVVRAMQGFALKVGDIVEGEPVVDAQQCISKKAFMQFNVFAKGDRHYTHLQGVIYDFEQVE